MSFRSLIVLMLLIIATESWADPSFERFLSLLGRESQKSTDMGNQFYIDDALGTLKSQTDFEPLFKYYTLAKKSRSLQAGTEQAPRVLLFGNTAKLILTFNSVHSTHGGYAIETAEFHEKTNRILFREVIFKDELPAYLKERLSQWKSLKDAPLEDLKYEFQLSDDEIEFEDQKIVVTQPNPSKCLQCHRLSDNYPTYARYIWSDYSTWKGFYGENDDALSYKDNKELSELERFKSEALSSKRYRHLSGLNKFAYPYYVGESKAGAARFRPNMLLTQYLYNYQASSVAQIFYDSSTPDQINKLVDEFLCKKTKTDIMKDFFDGFKYNVDYLLAALHIDETREEYDIDFADSSITGAFTLTELIREYVLRLIGKKNVQIKEKFGEIENYNQYQADNVSGLYDKNSMLPKESQYFFIKHRSFYENTSSSPKFCK